MATQARQGGGPAVSVVVVAHDSGADLLRCAGSVLAQPLPLELIVVDNASADGTIARLPADARIRLLLNPDNRGFARACNQGAALARAGMLLFLNPDCELPEAALATLLETFARDAGVGLLGAQLLEADGSPQAASARRDPSPWRAVREALGWGRDVPAVTGRVDASHDAPVRVDAVSGALMLVPQALFGELGGFDEGYVLHCEDLDLCRRVRAHGKAVALAPQVRVVHRKGSSSRRRPVWVEWQKHRGMWRYFRRFEAAATPAPLRPVLWLGLWAHFAVAAPRAWLRARRARAY